MNPETPTDLAPYRRVALFTLALSAAVIGAIALARLNLPTQWAPIGGAWAMLCGVLLSPPLILERWRTALWPRDLLAGPCSIAVLLALWLLTYLGALGLGLIVLVAALALIAALRAELPALSGKRLAGWAGVTLVFAMLLAANLDGTRYASFIADRLMLFGRADGDTMFYGALINAWRYHGVLATGIDGIAPTTYHAGAEILAARIAAMTGAEAVPTLIAVRAVLLAPLACFAIAAGGLVWARRRGAGRSRPIRAVLIALLLVIGASAIRISTIGFESESLILAGALLMLAFPSYFLRASGDGLGRLGWITGVLLILPLAAAKISFGFVWAGLFGWWALRKLGLRRAGFWLVAIADVSLLALGLWLFRPAQASVVWFGTPYYLEIIRDGDVLGPILINLLGFAVVGILWRAARRPQPETLSGRQARDAVESLAIVFLLANLPGALTEIYASNAIYFVLVFCWLAVPLATGEILLQSERQAGRKGAYALAGVAIIACIVGATLTTLREWRIIVGTEALIRTGDLQYYHGKSARGFRAGAAAAVKDLGLRGVFTATPVRSPAEDLIAAIRQFRSSAGNGGSVYVAPDTQAYWALTEDCDGKSLFAMATAGVPLLNGYYPDQTGCPQEVALAGYAGVPANLGQALNGAGICAHAAAIRTPSVLVVSAVTPELKTRVLSCSAPAP
jgi:hypothetical protein